MNNNNITYFLLLLIILPSYNLNNQNKITIDYNNRYIIAASNVLFSSRSHFCPSSSRVDSGLLIFVCAGSAQIILIGDHHHHVHRNLAYCFIHYKECTKPTNTLPLLFPTSSCHCAREAYLQLQYNIRLFSLLIIIMKIIQSLQ